MDRWEVRHDLYEDVEVVRWLPIAHECRTKKLGPAKEAEGYGKTGAV